jgi:hypothetical protein
LSLYQLLIQIIEKDLSGRDKLISSKKDNNVVLQNYPNLYNDEYQISKLNVVFLSETLPVSVDEFYQLFLSENAPYSYSKYFQFEKMLVFF